MEFGGKKMKNCWKKGLSCLLVSAMVTSMVACGGSGSDGSEAKKTDDKKTETSSGDAKEIDWYSAILKEEGCQEIAENFEKETGIKVNVHSYDSADFVQAFMVAANGGSPVDVMLLNGQDVRNFVRQGLIQDMSESPYLERVTDAAVNQYTYDGKTYAIGAKGGNSSGIYINKDIFEQYEEEAPETLQDIYDFNEKLKADGLSFFAFGGGNKYMWPMWYFETIAQTTENTPVETTEAILRGEAKFTDEPSLEGFKVIEDMAKHDVWQQGFNGTDSDPGKAMFINGKAAAFYGGTWEITSLIEAGMENLDLIPFPMVTDKEGVKSIQTGNASDGAWTIYTKIDPERQSAAEKFIEYVTRDDIVEGFRDSDNQQLRDYAAVTANKNVPVPEDAHPLTKKHIEMLETMTFTHPDWIYPGEVTTALQDALQKLTGLQITAEEAAQDVQDALDGMLADGYDYDKVESLE